MTGRGKCFSSERHITSHPCYTDSLINRFCRCPVLVLYWCVQLGFYSCPELDWHVRDKAPLIPNVCYFRSLLHSKQNFCICLLGFIFAHFTSYSCPDESSNVNGGPVYYENPEVLYIIIVKYRVEFRLDCQLKNGIQTSY